MFFRIIGDGSGDNLVEIAEDSGRPKTIASAARLCGLSVRDLRQQHEYLELQAADSEAAADSGEYEIVDSWSR